MSRAAGPGGERTLGVVELQLAATEPASFAESE